MTTQELDTLQQQLETRRAGATCPVCGVVHHGRPCDYGGIKALDNYVCADCAYWADVLAPLQIIVVTYGD
jgi:hypothetical protein